MAISVILLIILLILLIIVGCIWYRVHVSEQSKLLAYDVENHLYRDILGQFYKVYPLCCDECKRRAMQVLSEYQAAESMGLAVPHIEKYYTCSTKPCNKIKDSEHGYLVMRLEKFTALDTDTSTLTINGMKLGETMKHYGITNIADAGMIGVRDVITVSETAKNIEINFVIINLDKYINT
jgi:hypothetical protein